MNETLKSATDILMDVLEEEIADTEEKIREAKPKEATVQPVLQRGKTKRCSRCQQILPLEDFSKHSRNRDGRQSTCKACQRAYDRERYAKTKASWAIGAPTSPQGKTSKPVAKAKVNPTPKAKAKPAAHAKTPPAPVKRGRPEGPEVPKEMTKRCGTCGTTKPISDFNLDKTTADGRYRMCKTCTRTANRLRYLARKEFRGPKIHIDFTSSPELLDEIKALAEAEMRDINSQIIYACKTYIAMKGGEATEL